MSKTVKAVLAAVAIVLVGVILYFVVSSIITNSKEVDFIEFNKRIEDPRGDTDSEIAGEYKDSEQIKKIRVDGYNIYGYTSTETNTYSWWANYSSL